MSIPHELPSPAEPARLRFGVFLLDLRRVELTRAGAPLPLRPKAFALLSDLVRHAGTLRSRKDLLAAVWPGVVVGDDSLSQCIAELRAALDEPGRPSCIQTLPRLGYRFDADVQPERDAAAATLAFQCGRAPPALDTEVAARRSIVVMPFADLAGLPHFAEGVTDDVVGELARSPDTLVIGRGSGAALRARGESDPRRIGAELGVRHVLTGAVRRQHDEVQLDVQLSETQRGEVLWARRFDYGSAGPWSWRHDVSEGVAAAVGVKLRHAVADAAPEVARSGAAIDAWMRGQFVLRRVGSRDDLLQARRHFEAALAADPHSMNALVALGRTHYVALVRRWAVGAERLAAATAAKDCARRALEASPQHPHALWLLGQAQTFLEEYDDAERALRAAIAAQPGNADAHRDLAALLYAVARFDEVKPVIETALRLNPLEPEHLWACHTIVGMCHLVRERYDEAYEHLRASAQADPRMPNAHLHLVAVEVLRGHIDEARRHLAETLRLRPWSVEQLEASRRSTHPAFVAAHRRYIEAVRVAGLPERAAEGASTADSATR